MNATPQARTIGPWKEIQDGLAGSFTARSRGFLGGEFVVSGSDGKELGRLKMRGLQGAKLELGDLEAVIERTADARYKMLSGDDTMLETRPASASADRLKVWCGKRDYTATISFLRNWAVVRNAAGNEAVRLSGNITGRTYEVETDVGDAYALPVAVFLLYHTASRRRRAYLVATGG